MGTMLVVAAAAIVSVGSAAGVSVAPNRWEHTLMPVSCRGSQRASSTRRQPRGWCGPLPRPHSELTRTAGTDEFALSIVATITSEQTNTDSLCVFNTTRTFEGTGTFWFGGLQFEGEELLGIESPNCPGSNRALADPSPNSGGARGRGHSRSVPTRWC